MGSEPLMTNKPDQFNLAREAKAIVVLAFRNGPIEDLHAGKPCSSSRLTTRMVTNGRSPMVNGARRIGTNRIRAGAACNHAGDYIILM
jgi:hypothetical protein